MGVKLRSRIRELIKREKVLNTAECCRLLNKFGKNDYKKCYPRRWDFRQPSSRTRDMCLWRSNKCDPTYYDVYEQLFLLKKRGYVRSTKMRFYEKTKDTLPTDLFRFWYEDKEAFERIVLSQTLIPYVR